MSDALDVAAGLMPGTALFEKRRASKKVSGYVRTLVHDPESYGVRTVLFNAIIYLDGDLARPDREIGALGASLVNGCRYCAVVHARRHAELTKNDDVVKALHFDRADTLGPRDAATYVWSD